MGGATASVQSVLMEEDAVRSQAQDYCAALHAGDVERSSEHLSKELRSNMGQLVAMLPMPMTEATVESVDRTPTGFRTVLHLVGEGTETRLETRWKERDGRPVIVEVSNLPDETAPGEAAPEATDLEG